MNRFFEVEVYSDGSRKPGEVRCCYIVKTENKVMRSVKVLSGDMSSNEAEYMGALYGLKMVEHPFNAKVRLYSDSRVVVSQLSKMVVSQLNGKWRCRNGKVREMLRELWEIITRFQTFEAIWVRREDNPAGRMLEGYTV